MSKHFVITSVWIYIFRFISSFTHTVCQQLQDTTTWTVVICWAEWAEIKFPPLYFLDESLTHTLVGDHNMRSVVGHRIQPNFPAVISCWFSHCMCVCVDLCFILWVCFPLCFHLCLCFPCSVCLPMCGISLKVSKGPAVGPYSMLLLEGQSGTLYWSSLSLGQHSRFHFVAWCWLCDGDSEESDKRPAGLDVCIYYTLEEIMQNRSDFVSCTHWNECVCVCVFFFFICAQTRPKEQVSIPQESGLNPVHLCFLWSKGISPRLNPPNDFQPLAE